MFSPDALATLLITDTMARNVAVDRAACCAAIKVLPASWNYPQEFPAVRDTLISRPDLLRRVLAVLRWDLDGFYLPDWLPGVSPLSAAEDERQAKAIRSAS